MTPPKLTVLLLSGLLRANLVSPLRSYGHLKFLSYFVVLIRPFLVQIFIVKRAQVNDVLKNFGKKIRNLEVLIQLEIIGTKFILTI